MSEEKKQLEFYEIADKYIDLANDLAKSVETKNIGTALRYAAARYNTFEASFNTKDLAKEKEKVIDLLVNDFREMLNANMDDYIQLISKRQNQ
jgi:hypothetical protein